MERFTYRTHIINISKPLSRTVYLQDTHHKCISLIFPKRQIDELSEVSLHYHLPSCPQSISGSVMAAIHTLKYIISHQPLVMQQTHTKLQIFTGLCLATNYIALFYSFVWCLYLGVELYCLLPVNLKLTVLLHLRDEALMLQQLSPTVCIVEKVEI